MFGKGGKTRHILLTAGTWEALCAIRDDAGADDPVFVSRKGSRLSMSQALRIVRNAAKRAGVDLTVSPHWLRHCHGSHALGRGAAAHLVQATLGHASVATTRRYLHARPTGEQFEISRCVRLWRANSGRFRAAIFIGLISPLIMRS